jgi:uncharacterized protein
MFVTPLTGSMATSELPRIGDGPVTVTVARSVLPGHEADFEAIVARMEPVLLKFPGCLGVGVLRPGVSGGEYHIVFRFTDPVSLRRWERSDERAAALGDLETLVADTRVQRVSGVEEFFELPDHQPPARPVWRSILSDVGWVFPVALTSSLVVSPHLTAAPAPMQVAIGALLITSVMTFAVTPVRHALRRRRRDRIS